MKSNHLIRSLLYKLVSNKFKFQDPRMPNYLKQYNLPEKRMDSPVYRCALESICKNTKVTSFLEIGVKEGESLRVVLEHSHEVEKVYLCDFWNINKKKISQFEIVKNICLSYLSVNSKSKFVFLDGSSSLTTKTIKSNFDLIGIDGSHRRDIFRNDLDTAFNLINENGFIVIDDLVLHEDNKIDQALMEFVNDNISSINVVYRNITNWPGAAILQKQSIKQLSLIAYIGNVININKNPNLSMALSKYTDAELISTIDSFILVQDWQAIDILIPEAINRNNFQIDNVLMRLLLRESLEVDNQRVYNYLINKSTPENKSHLESLSPINGLEWSSKSIHFCSEV